MGWQYQNGIFERAQMSDRILFVDDDEQILCGIVRSLSDDFDIQTATSGKQVIELFKQATFAVVVSDMRMPDMNGARLLKYVYENYPETIRLLLTGQSGIEDSTAAINDGHIFRLLNEPCPPAALAQSLRDALDQWGVSRSLDEMVDSSIGA